MEYESIEERAEEIMEMGKTRGVQAIIQLVHEAIDTVEQGYEELIKL